MKKLEESYPNLFADAKQRAIRRMTIIQLKTALFISFLICLLLFLLLPEFLLGWFFIFIVLLLITEVLIRRFLPFGKITKKMMSVACKKSYIPMEYLEGQADEYRLDNSRKEERIKELTRKLAELETPEGQKFAIESMKEGCRETIKNIEAEINENKSWAEYKEAVVSFLEELYKE